MRALVYEGKQKVVLKNVPKPIIKADEVLLQIKSVGICGTDLHIYNGGTDVRRGTIIGHEFSGTIDAIGKQVTTLKTGARVVAEHVLNCGKCYYCLRGQPNLCMKAEVYGLQRAGALAEFMAVPARLVYPIPRTLSFDDAALVEPLTIALFAASSAGFLLEKRVAVLGQGPIGLLLDQVLEAAGARVIGIDVIDNRLAFAKKKGWAHHTLNSSRKDFRKQYDTIAGMGVDAVFEAVGKDATVELALELPRRDGNVFLLGVFEKPATIDLMKLVKKELNVFGSWTCSFSFPAAIELVAEKKIDLTSLVTHRYDFADAPKAFADSATYSGNRIKTIIRVS
ncbi:MAG: alcohol dehydrogenase catalytic domain-containing protein [Candidatus Kerfeldbacteria bacterium]|nr:alcohol dehydrogenase catalytic domain-containing protein [Candidatus Kerfeldbacteria bacterium]